MVALTGMRGTGDWVTNQRPENWRDALILIYPNPKGLLTAVTGKMKSKSTDDPNCNWWTKDLAAQAGSVTSIYIDAGLGTEYVYATHQATNGAAADTVYAKCAAAVAEEFRPGHQVVLRDASEPTVDLNAKVTSVVENGASSYIACKLLEADDNGRTAASYNLATVDRILIAGNINAEGAEIPDALAYDPTQYTNYTQIFRTALELTGTALQTRLRTGDAYAEAKREALELHSIEMEKAFIWGLGTSGTGSNSKPERTMDGIVRFIRTNASDNAMDYRTDSDFSGQDWETGGEEWFDESLEVIFRKGSERKLCFAGSGALLGLNRTAKLSGQIQLKGEDTAYGLKVQRWITPFGELAIKRHPLFSYETTDRNSLLIVEPELMTYRPMKNRDTHFRKDVIYRKGNWTARDALKEEWLTECTLEYHNVEAFGYLTGVGLDNAV